MNVATMPLSALDIAPIETGTTARHALRNTVELGRRLERFGYRRMWVAEHHGANASSAPSVLVAQIAAATSTIRVGSGGVMLPNHATLAVAEQFATLDAFHPGRIDLGVGRGPGALSEAVTAALRRGAPPATDEEYAREVRALLELISGEVSQSALTALPEHENSTEPWLLSSSTAGAKLAARLGLPIAFAHHIRPDNTIAALADYRTEFQPSRWSDKPHVMVCVQTICAETDESAAELAQPANVALAHIATKRLPPFPTPDAAATYAFTDSEHMIVQTHLRSQAHGAPDTVVRKLAEIVERTGADELMLTTPVYDIDARARSYDLVATQIAQPVLRRG
ncbi:LLM class flavin-dependent oxidoreductase [Streptomyces sp. NPDC059627]